jgi:hypothetical protein
MQGVAALPVPEQMFNPESYASGGIVAFDEGGDVSTNEVLRASLGSPIELLGGRSIGEVLSLAHPNLSGLAEYSSQGGYSSPALQGGGRGAMQGGNLNLNNASGLGMAQGGVVAFEEGGDTTEKRRKQAEEDRRLMKRIGYDTLRLPGGVVDILGGGYNALATGADSIANAVGLPRLGRALGIYDPEVSSVALPKVGSGGPTPGQDYINSRINQMYDPQVPATPSAPVTQAQAPFPGPYAPNLDPVAVAEKQAEILRAKAQAENSVPTANLNSAAVAQRQPQGVITSGLTNPFRDISLPDRPTLDKEGFLGKEQSMEGIQSLRKDAYKRAGVSEEVYDEMRKDVKNRIEGLSGERGDAVAHAMIMAGLGIAGGTSQFALQNIAQGAIPAMTGFRSDIKELNNRRDKLAEREFTVMDAQNKFRQTGADSDLKELNEANKDRRAAEREFTKLKTTVDEKYNDRAFQLKGEIAKADMDITKTKIEASLKQQEIDIRRLDANSQDMYRKRPELLSTVLDILTPSKKYQEASETEKIKMITDAVSDARSTGSGSLGLTYRSKLLEQFNSGGAQRSIYKDIESGKQKHNGQTGKAAADAYKDSWIESQMRAAGVNIPTGAASGNVVDFNSLP